MWHEGGMLRREHSPPHDKCHWIPQKVLSIPARAAFTSYAGLAIRGNYLLVSSKVVLLCSCWILGDSRQHRCMPEGSLRWILRMESLF